MLENKDFRHNAYKLNLLRISMDWPSLMVFIRHGEAASGADNSLTERGRNQAIITGNEIRKRYGEFDVYFASELVRAKETMTLAFPERKLIIDGRLNEDGLTLVRGSEIDAVYDGATRENKASSNLPRPLKDESEIEDIVDSFIQMLCKDYSGKKVVVGTHWGWLNVKYDQMREHGFEEKVRDEFDKNCSVAIYHKNENGRLVQDERNLIFY